MNIQWYPGHMAKAVRRLRECLSLVDVVIELLDARIPRSSKNPAIDELAAGKRRIVALNKADAADPPVTELWLKYYRGRGLAAVAANSLAGDGLDAIYRLAGELMREKMEANRARGRLNTPIRAMTVGVPNVGKSTLINRYMGRPIAKTGDKPGVTRANQWIKIREGFELLDTPGLLWPRFDDPAAGVMLACTGAISDDIVDKTALAWELIKILAAVKPACFEERYGVPVSAETAPADALAAIGGARGFKLKGGAVDTERAAIMLLDEFRGGKLGGISLERPEAGGQMPEAR